MPEEKTTTQEAEPEDVKCPSTWLMGPPGSGKTYALISYIEAGLDLFVAITDPGGEETLLDALKEHDLPLEKLHYNYIPCAAPSWDALWKAADMINRFSYKDLTEMKGAIAPADYRQFLDLLSLLRDFKDSRTGECFGPVEELGTDCAIVIDSVSGLDVMALDLMVGGKPVPHKGEWGVSMSCEEKLILKMVADCRCFVCFASHIEKHFYEAEGTVLIMPMILGQKLAPKIPRVFSDIVLAVKEGNKFSWSTSLPGADLKARNLPIQDGLDPSFKPIVEKWRSRQAQVGRKSKAA